MPYKKVSPATDGEMKKSRYQYHHTICQTLREIWREEKDPALQEKLKLAMTMAKRMHNKLKEYQAYRETEEYKELFGEE
jgi:hypothetical protein